MENAGNLYRKTIITHCQQTKDNGLVTQSVTLDDGTVLIVKEVIPPRSTIDRLMDGESVNLTVHDSDGDEWDLHMAQLHGVGVCGDVYEVDGVWIATRTFLVHSGNTKWLCIVGLEHEGKPVDLDELRRRVAIREIERLAPFVNMADLGELLPKQRPDMSKEWWVIERDGLPELEEGVLYVSYWWNARQGRESTVALEYCGDRYSVLSDTVLADGHDDIVTRIKEAN